MGSTACPSRGPEGPAADVASRFVPLKTIEIKDGTPAGDLRNIIKEEVAELTNQLKEDEQ